MTQGEKQESRDSRIDPKKEKIKKRRDVPCLISRLLFGYNIHDVKECVARYKRLSSSKWIFMRRIRHPWRRNLPETSSKGKEDRDYLEEKRKVIPSTAPHEKLQQTYKSHFISLDPTVLSLVLYFSPTHPRRTENAFQTDSHEMEEVELGDEIPFSPSKYTEQEANVNRYVAKILKFNKK